MPGSIIISRTHELTHKEIYPPIHYTQNYRKDDGREESIDSKSRDDSRYQQDDDTIDHEGEKSESEQVYRESEDDEEGFDEGVDDSQSDGDEKCSEESIYLHTRS